MDRSNRAVVLFYRTVSLLLPVAERLSMTPDKLSWLGFLLSAVAGGLFVFHPLSGGIALLSAGLCDVLDGMLARKQKKTSPAGAFLDSVLDRYGETVVLAGIWGYLYRTGMGGTASTLLIIAAISGSLMVSYTRARGEGLGVSCHGGFFQRPERVLILAGGGFLENLLPDWGLASIVFLLALGANITAATRFRLILLLLRKKDGAESVD